MVFRFARLVHAALPNALAGTPAARVYAAAWRPDVPARRVVRLFEWPVALRPRTREHTRARAHARRYHATLNVGDSLAVSLQNQARLCKPAKALPPATAAVTTFNMRLPLTIAQWRALCTLGHMGAVHAPKTHRRVNYATRVARVLTP